MQILLVDHDNRQSRTNGDVEGVPQPHDVFVSRGYPFLCREVLPEDEDTGLPCVVVGEPPIETVRSLLKSGVEDLARTNYAFSVRTAGEGPKWDAASALTRWQYRMDADQLIDEQRRALGPAN